MKRTLVICLSLACLMFSLSAPVEAGGRGSELRLGLAFDGFVIRPARKFGLRTWKRKRRWSSRRHFSRKTFWKHQNRWGWRRGHAKRWLRDKQPRQDARVVTSKPKDDANPATIRSLRPARSGDIPVPAAVPQHGAGIAAASSHPAGVETQSQPGAAPPTVTPTANAPKAEKPEAAREDTVAHGGQGAAAAAAARAAALAAQKKSEAKHTGAEARARAGSGVVEPPSRLAPPIKARSCSKYVESAGIRVSVPCLD